MPRKNLRRRIYKGWMYIRLSAVHRVKIYIYLSFIYLNISIHACAREMRHQITPGGGWQKRAGVFWNSLPGKIINTAKCGAGEARQGFTL